MKTLVFAATLGITGLFASTAEAANLTGPGTINFAGSAIFRQVVLNDNGTPGNLLDDISRTDVDFRPNVAVPTGGYGGITIPESGGVDGFSGFNGTNPALLFSNFASVIKDASIDQSLPPTYLSSTITDFIRLRDETGLDTGTTFNLERVDLPFYTTSGTGPNALTTATLNVYGTWNDTVSGDSYLGEGQFTAQFVGFSSEAEVLQALRQPAGFRTAYSASITAEAREVPEPANLLGLAAFGVFAFMAFKPKMA